MKSLLACTYNTRELGGFVTPRGTTLYDRLWRSDAPVEYIPEDAALLREKGITTVIDMRTGYEVEKRPCAFDRDGFEYHNFPIFEGCKPPDTLEGVPLSYMDIAASDSIREVFRTIALADTGVLFHCTAGKDRTGVVSAVILSAVGADRGDIINDYSISREYNREVLERVLREHPELNRAVLMASESSMDTFLTMFAEKYGSAQGYFEAMGIGFAYAAIRRRLLDTV